MRVVSSVNYAACELSAVREPYILLFVRMSFIILLGLLV